MCSTEPSLLYTHIGNFVDQLAVSGVRHVCISPGSRSTPLALCVADHPRLQLWLHPDERSAAFFALGLSKATRQPVGLVCTSGTAAANYLPALVEARYSKAPLVIMTADRPLQLRDSGAPQTIDQVHIYGRYVKWFADLAPPGAGDDCIRYARVTAGRAVAMAVTGPAGPVHINIPMAEPLVPRAGMPDIKYGPTVACELETVARPIAPPGGAETLLDQLAAARRPVIVCGPYDDPGLADPLATTAAALGCPLLADPLSGLRCGGHDLSAVIDAYDAFLRVGPLTRRLEPDLIIRIGGTPTSKALMQYLRAHRHAPQIIIDPHAAWHDPDFLATHWLQADPSRLFGELIHHLPLDRSRQSWLQSWRQVNDLARRAVTDKALSFQQPFEGRVFLELAPVLPDGSLLFAGNSMPVRDLDAFFPSSSARIRCLANRGANGIDGVVSSALGVAAAGIGPTVLVIGDLSFFHDLNGLLLAKKYRLDLTVILINNDGGGIFSFLPQAGLPRHFDLLFGTPHGLDFRHAAALFDAEYSQVTTWTGFRHSVQTGLAQGGLHILELPTNRALNAEQHRSVWSAVMTVLGREGWCR